MIKRAINNKKNMFFQKGKLITKENEFSLSNYQEIKNILEVDVLCKIVDISNTFFANNYFEGQKEILEVELNTRYWQKNEFNYFKYLDKEYKIIEIAKITNSTTKIRVGKNEY